MRGQIVEFCGAIHPNGCTALNPVWFRVSTNTGKLKREFSPFNFHRPITKKCGGLRPGSPSRALLRLRPSHWAWLRPSYNGEPSAIPSSLELTGGEYKGQEHIHRGVADPRLLAIPASRGRVAALDPN